MTHNKSIDEINRLVTRLGRMAKAQKLEEKQNKRQQIVERLRFVAEDMREAGASEQSIHLAVQGTYEYLKVALDEKLDQSAEKLIKNPDSALEHTQQMPVTVLSQVKTQQVDWLWQRRIPLGKITILDGDPGMGKSLLAIFIAACVSTGQPMPDGAPGKQGKVILIAPEDAAEDTIKPRVEAAGGDPSQVILLETVEDLDILDSKK
jgi:hypothetical protein